MRTMLKELPGHLYAVHFACGELRVATTRNQAEHLASQGRCCAIGTHEAPPAIGAYQLPTATHSMLQVVTAALEASLAIDDSLASAKEDYSECDRILEKATAFLEGNG